MSFSAFTGRQNNKCHQLSSFEGKNVTLQCSQYVSTSLKNLEAPTSLDFVYLPHMVVTPLLDWLIGWMIMLFFRVIARKSQNASA